MVYFEQSKLKVLNFGIDDMYNISRRSQHGQSKGIRSLYSDHAGIYGRSLYNFSPFRLAERKDSRRLSTAVKRQVGRSSVMACSSVTYENMNFYETGQATDPF